MMRRSTNRNPTRKSASGFRAGCAKFISLVPNARGFVAVEFVAGLGLLVLPIALAVMAFPTWAERQELARIAAREASRTYALTNDASRAQDVARQVASNYGVDPGQITVSLDAMPDFPIQPGDTVSATVTVKVPALDIGVMNLQSAEFDYSETHAEPLDVYRSRVVTP